MLGVALILTLSRAPLVVSRANLTSPESSEPLVARIPSGRARVCQGGEIVPRATAALDLGAGTDTLGPAVSVEVLAAGRTIARGRRAAGWRGPGLVVPLGPIRATVANATICFSTGPLQETMILKGAKHPAGGGLRIAGHAVAGKLKIRYLRRASSSWLGTARAIARRMGLGHAPGGAAGVLAAFVAVVLMVLALAWLLLLELAGSRRARPRAVPLPALVCMAVAFLNGAAWSIVSPPYQNPDEEAHFAYVQQLAEAGSLPREALDSPFSAEEEASLADLRFNDLRLDSISHTIDSREAQAKLERDLRANSARRGSGNAGVAASEPPLYYALETVPYALGSGGDILVRIELMRLLSALLCAASALFAYLFLRELLPGARWAWSVGALVAALAPVAGAIAGAINPDALLCTISTASFYLLARGFRRGLTPGLSLAIGAAIALGLITKLNYVGLAPGALAGLVLLSTRTSAPLRRLAPALLVLLAPLAAYALLAALRDPAGLERVWSAIPDPFPHGSKLGELNYLWQSYLPRLPGTATVFQGVSPWLGVWFRGLVGDYGWDDIYFSDRALTLALVIALVPTALLLRAVFVGRVQLRSRLGELAVYATMSAGLLAVIGLASYQEHPGEALEYRQARYLLPLLALGSAGAALAARGAGRRWGPAVGVLIVLLVLADDLFSQLLVIARYYG